MYMKCLLLNRQNIFVEFLYWLKAGKHTSGKMNILPNNGTCNAYLKDVFRFYLFIEEEFSQFGGLKVLSYSQFTAVDSVGLKRKRYVQKF